ncbi:uncharacterized protein LOC142331702 [Lycorma delicatula]|uniref:uncharacterized protein LOC142331702 n=1 Tax=Lycorma delicatula TaxID=130591 RepID=UPI003F50E76C
MSINIRSFADENRRLDNIITQLFRAQNNFHLRTPFVHLCEDDVYFLCSKVRDIFLNEPSLLELRPPLKVFGDIHGQFLDLLHWFNCIGSPADVTFLFLGDYVDRGRQSVETICLLFAYKIKYPKKMNLLRGNHESAGINKVYGFFDECKRRYSVKLWKTFTDCFNCLPIAAVIDYKIFCCHGGLSPHLEIVEQIKKIERPTDIPESGLLTDILWSDPEGGGFKGWAPSDRGISYVFGADVVRRFLLRNDMDLVCRAHQVVEDGYEFFANQSLVTIFSAPNYCGEFSNSAAILIVDENLVCSFMTVKPYAAKSYKPFNASSYNPTGKSFWPKIEDNMDIDL